MKTFHTFSSLSLSLSHDNGQVLTVLEFPGSDVRVRLLHWHVGRLRDPPDHQDSQVGVGVTGGLEIMFSLFLRPLLLTLSCPLSWRRALQEEVEAAQLESFEDNLNNSTLLCLVSVMR